jgi:hypothetical protein
MIEHSHESTRRRLERFLARKGHGAVGRISEASGVSRQYLRRFRNGEEVEKKVLLAIEAALDSLERPLAKEQAAAYESPAGPNSLRIPREGRTLPLPSSQDIEDALRLARRARAKTVEAELRHLQEDVFNLVDEGERIAKRFDETLSRLAPKPSQEKKK